MEEKTYWPDKRTDRIRVPGGWLYRTIIINGVHTCFVQDTNNQTTVGDVMREFCAQCQLPKETCDGKDNCKNYKEKLLEICV